MRTSFHHQSEAQPPNGPLTAATSPDTPSPAPATQSGLHHPQAPGRGRASSAVFRKTKRYESAQLAANGKFGSHSHTTYRQHRRP
jgi:hypothetical protein